MIENTRLLMKAFFMETIIIQLDDKKQAGGEKKYSHAEVGRRREPEKILDVYRGLMTHHTFNRQIRRLSKITSFQEDPIQ